MSHRPAHPLSSRVRLNRRQLNRTLRRIKARAHLNSSLISTRTLANRHLGIAQNSNPNDLLSQDPLRTTSYKHDGILVSQRPMFSTPTVNRSRIQPIIKRSLRPRVPRHIPAPENMVAGHIVTILDITSQNLLITTPSPTTYPPTINHH